MANKVQTIKSDSEYVDLAAERIAGLFIEQAKYNRSRKQGLNRIENQPIDQIKLELRYFWEPILSDETIKYHYPMPLSVLMKKKYKKPAIYRWNIYKHTPDDQKLIYVGETELLCPRRIKGYLSPGPTQQTNKRLMKIFGDYIKTGLKISLEVLNIQFTTMNKIPIVEQDLSNKYTRRLIEAALVVKYQNKGYTLLNY